MKNFSFTIFNVIATVEVPQGILLNKVFLSIRGRGFWVNFCKKCGDCGECGEQNNSPLFTAFLTKIHHQTSTRDVPFSSTLKLWDVGSRKQCSRNCFPSHDDNSEVEGAYCICGCWALKGEVYVGSMGVGIWGGGV